MSSSHSDKNSRLVLQKAEFLDVFLKDVSILRNFFWFVEDTADPPIQVHESEASPFLHHRTTIARLFTNLPKRLKFNLYSFYVEMAALKTLRGLSLSGMKS